MECHLSTFISNATVEDYNARGVALTNLINLLPCDVILEAVLQSGWSLFQDTSFIETTNQIREMLQVELG